MKLSLTNFFKKVSSFVVSNPPLALVILGLFVALISIPLITLSINSVREPSGKAATCTVSHTFTWSPAISYDPSLNVYAQWFDWRSSDMGPDEYYNAQLGSTNSSYRRNDLAGGTTYYYRVYTQIGPGINDGDDFYALNWTAVQTTPCPEPTPGTLSRTIPTTCQDSNYSVTLRWSTPAGSNWYVDISEDSSFGGYSNKKLTAGSTSTSAPSGFSGGATLEPGKSYYWRIYNGVDQFYGPSWAVIRCVSTPTDPGTLSRTIPTTCQDGNYSVTLKWSNPAGNNWYADISESSSFDGFVNKQLTAGSTSTSAPSGFSNNATLEPNKTYYWRIFNGSQTFDGPQWAVIKCAAVEPGTLSRTIPTTCQDGNYSVTLRWTNAAGSNWFADISESSVFNGFANKQLTAGSTSTSAPSGFSNNATLEPGKVYYWRISNGSQSFEGPSWGVIRCTSDEPGTMSRTIPTTCQEGNYSVTFSWANPAGAAWFLDISENSTFSGYTNKQLTSGSTSTTAPAGFSGGATLQPDKTYYWRIYNGNKYFNGNSWAVIKCAVVEPGTLSRTIPTTCQDSNYSITLRWSNPAGSNWFVDVSESSSFSGYANKQLTAGSTSTAAPSGFSNGAVIEPGKTYYWRIYNGSKYFDGPQWAVIRCTSIEPGTLSRTIPTTCQDNNYSVTLKWSNTAGNNWYADISESSFFSGFANKLLTAGTTSTTAPSGFSNGAVLEPNKTYYWRISNGSQTFEGPSWSVIRCTAAPVPPGQTIIGNPPDMSCVTNNPSITFRWSRPSGTVTGYFVDIFTSAIGGSYWNTDVLSASTTQLTWDGTHPIDGQIPQAGTSYFWRVWAFNGAENNGTYSDPSSGRSFTVSSNLCGGFQVPLPATPITSNPPLGMTCSGENPVVPLVWSSSGGGAVTGYWLDVATSPISDSPVNYWNERIGTNSSTYTYEWSSSKPILGQVPTSGQTYYWRVYAFNTNGGVEQGVHSSPTTGRSFTTPDCGRPAAPSNLSVSVSCVADYTPSVTFSWNGSARAANYWLDVSKTGSYTVDGDWDNAFLPVRSVGDTGAYQFVWASPNKTLSHGMVPENNKAYYWRVFAENNAGGNYASYNGSVIKDCAPAIPDVQIPDVPIIASTVNCTGPAISFNWSTTARATGYWLDVATQPIQGNVPYSNIQFDNSVPGAQPLGTSFNWNSSKTISGQVPENGTTYYYRVFAYNSAGGTHSNPNTGLTAKVECGNLSKPNPVDPSTMSWIPSCASDKPSIKFVFGKSSVATGYWLDVATDAGFSNFGNASVAPSSSSLQEVTWNAGSPLGSSFVPENKTSYYWRVYAYNANGGNHTLYSSNPISYDCTGSSAPGKPVNLVSTPSCEAGKPQIYFRWSLVDDADGYWLDVSKGHDGFMSGEHYGNREFPDKTLNGFQWTEDQKMQFGDVPEINTDYDWRVYAYKNTGKGTYSEVVPVSGKISCGLLAPENFSVTAAETGTPTFQWSGVSNATSYSVQVSSSGFRDFYECTTSQTSVKYSSCSWVVFVGGSPTSSSAPSALPSATNYQARVYARNGSSLGQISNAIDFSVRGASLPPANLQAQAVGGECAVLLSWTNSNVNWFIDIAPDAAFSDFWNKRVDSVTSLKVNKDTGFASPTLANPLTFEQGKTYYWRIYYGVTNTWAQGPSFTVNNCNTVPANPEVASGLSAVASCVSGKPQVYFTWNRANNVTGYWIDIYKTTGGNRIDSSHTNVHIDQMAEPGFVWSDAPGHRTQQNQVPEAGVVYQWSIFSHNDANGVSSPNFFVDVPKGICNTVTPPEAGGGGEVGKAPEAVTSASVVDMSCIQATKLPRVKFEWVRSELATGYWLDVSTSPLFAEGTVSNKNFVNTGGITYNFEWSASSKLSGGSASEPDNNTAYYFRVYAYNSIGGKHSATFSLNTPNCPGVIQEANQPSAFTLNVPSLGCAADSNPSIGFSWKKSERATGYYLDVSTTGEYSSNGYGGEWTNIQLPASENPSFTWNSGSRLANDWLPTNAKPYYWRVYAYNDFGNATVAGSSFSKNCGPGVVAGLAETMTSCTSDRKIDVTFNWNSAPDAGSYRVFLADRGRPGTWLAGVSVLETSDTWSGLLGDGTSERWFVRAYRSVDGSGGFADSPEKLFTKTDCPKPQPPSGGGGNTPAAGAGSCNGAYASYKYINVTGNFGDPNCDYSRNGVAQIIANYDPGNSSRWVCIINHESAWFPNAYNPGSTSGRGAYGLFQMNPAGGGNGVYDAGNVVWSLQTTNAINYNNMLIKNGNPFGYWEPVLRGLC